MPSRHPRTHTHTHTHTPTITETRHGSAAPRRRTRWISIGLPAALSLAALLGSAALVGCDSWFYHPNRHHYASRADLGLQQAEDVHFQDPGGPRLHGWWVPAQGKAQGTVVYMHGNHANLTLHARFVSWLPERGFNLLLFDYRGFGRSDGSPDRAGTVADGIAALDFALARDPDRTFVFGHSLGGAIGIVAAADRPAVRAIAVESTFPTYRAAARCTAPLLAFLVPLLVSSGHDPVDALRRAPPRPLLVIHGRDDDITPVHLAHELFAAAPEPKTLLVVDGCGHGTPWVQEAAVFEERLVDFFRAALQGPR